MFKTIAKRLTPPIARTNLQHTQTQPFASYQRLAAAMSTNTSTYKFNHSMLRVKDPKRSLKFYEHLGMKQIHKIQNPDSKFDLYFLGYDSPR